MHIYQKRYQSLSKKCSLEEIVRDEVETEVSGKIQEEILRRWDTSAEYDANVRQTLEEQFAYQYPYPKSHARKMKFTVSELKKMSYQAELDDEENALGEVVFEEPEVVPLLPKFMTEEETLTGAPRGTAYHASWNFSILKKCMIGRRWRQR